MSERKYVVDMASYKPGRSAVKKDEVKLKPSPIYKGVYTGTLVGPETGCFCSTHTVDLFHIPPGVTTGVYRHDDLLLHVLNGTGYSIIDDVKYEWGHGDSIHIKPGVWYQHCNPSKEPANMLFIKAGPYINAVKPFGPITPVGGGGLCQTRGH